MRSQKARDKHSMISARNQSLFQYFRFLKRNAFMVGNLLQQCCLSLHDNDERFKKISTTDYSNTDIVAKHKFEKLKSLPMNCFLNWLEIY